jgi:rhomboid family GlyGly-CTERM serine protease
MSPLRGPGRAWPALAGTLAAASVLAWWMPAVLLDWQPALAAGEPWRAWTAAAVHWSPLHLGANLLGTALVAALGVVARLPARAALSWLLAWPLTHLALLLQPDLLHYGGLSGVLHAGVAVAATWLLLGATGARRGLAAALLAGLLLKIMLEAPWGPPLRQAAGWDIALAPLAHATGAAAGVVCALLLAPWRRG